MIDKTSSLMFSDLFFCFVITSWDKFSQSICRTMVITKEAGVHQNTPKKDLRFQSSQITLNKTGICLVSKCHQDKPRTICPIFCLQRSFAY